LPLLPQRKTNTARRGFGKRWNARAAWSIEEQGEQRSIFNSPLFRELCLGQADEIQVGQGARLQIPRLTGGAQRGAPSFHLGSAQSHAIPGPKMVWLQFHQPFPPLCKSIKDLRRIREDRLGSGSDAVKLESLRAALLA